MIENFWSNVSFYCMHHAKYIKMVLQNVHNIPCYVCPDENHKTKIGFDCKNTVTMADAEKVVEHFMKIVEEAERDDEQINLKNARWEYKNVEYIVLKHNNYTFRIGCTNHNTETKNS